MKRRYWLGVLFGVVLLSSVGAGIATVGPWRARPGGTPSKTKERPSLAESSPAPDGPQPKLVIDKTDHDFGSVDMMAKAEHVFVVRNEGAAPLELTPGPTTCKCTIADLADRKVFPGKQGRIVVTWKPTEKQGPFKQTATIRTNDPAWRELDLQILGIVRVRLGAEPAQVILPALAPRTAGTAETLLFSQVWSKFTVGKIESSRVGLTCGVEPADPGRLKEQGACAGYRLKITLPNDLPGGHFSERLTIYVEPNDGATPGQTCQVGVAGEILARMVIYGEKIDRGNVLRFGTLRRGESTTEHLTLVLRDEPRQIAVQRIESRPEFLRVHVAPLSVDSSKAGVYRIDVEVPPNAPVANFMGVNRGEVVIVTDHPRVPRMQFKVELAVLSN